MVPRQSGRVIVTSSVEGKLGKPGIPGYSATKHAVNGLVKAAAQEVGTLGITVNAILPGIIETDIVRETGPDSAIAMGLQDYDSLISLFCSESAIKRPNTVEEVAAVAVLLASDLKRDPAREGRVDLLLVVVGLVVLREVLEVRRQVDDREAE
jgi:NAD(P)-dependent dehydrogenase (short-subunit alcohol dehydrogenase family)